MRSQEHDEDCGYSYVEAAHIQGIHQVGAHHRIRTRTRTSFEEELLEALQSLSKAPSCSVHDLPSLKLQLSNLYYCRRK